MVARAVSWFQWHYRSGGNVHTNEVLSFSTKDKDFLIFFFDWMKNASFVLIGQRYRQGCWLVKYETILKHLRPIVTSLQGATRNIIFGSIVVTFNQCRFARNARNASKVRRALSASNASRASYAGNAIKTTVFVNRFSSYLWSNWGQRILRVTFLP